MAVSPAIRCGAFALEQPLGQGGMAVVHRGRHARSGLPVAIKVITGRMAREPAYVEHFRREVQAVAGLDHAGIVRVFDYGRLGPEAAGHPSPALVPGSPYLVMELAEGGTLFERPPADWPSLRAAVLAVLDALAHAHARDIVHRDIKPANILIASDAALPRYVLSDFGIAFASGPSGVRRTDDLLGHAASGTPQYMAPEQLKGRWRDFGPWTDLYALGCVAFELACGRPPFQGRTVFEIVFRHIEQPRPPVTARFPVPPGFEPWLHRMMAVDRRRRFQRAADAARALRALDPGGGPVAVPDAPASLSSHPPPPTRALLVDDEEISGFRETDPAPDAGARSPDATVIAVRPETVPGTLPAAEALEATAAHAPLPGDGPDGGAPDADDDPATDWLAIMDAHGADVPGRRIQDGAFGDAGLGLFGLREVPFVGRRRERALLWATLREAIATGSPRGVIVRGMAGLGKSRLVEWTTRRAHELGVAHVLRARHGRVGGVGEGIAEMLERELCAWGLDPDAKHERICAELGVAGATGGTTGQVYEALALTALMSPDQTKFRFGSPRERHLVVGRFLEQLARRRPLVLWLDDLQWGPESAALATFLLAETTLPLAIFATVRDEAVDERSEAGRLLEQLEASERVRRLPLEPLEPADQVELVSRLLPLDDRLADRVCRRTEGNPLFAVQLVGDWVDRGLVEPGDHGFVTRAGRIPTLPSDIRRMWRHRLERLLDALPADERPAARHALELAAALGHRVDADEWRHACRLADAAPPAELLDAMMHRRLANRDRRGWAFVHGMLRETLADEARAAGRWRDHRSRCADALAAAHPAGGPNVSWRRAGHLLAAGRAEEALDALERAVAGFARLGQFERALETLDRGARAMDALGLDADHPRRVRGLLDRALYLLATGRTGEAQALIDDAEQRATRAGLDRESGRALAFRGKIAMARGELARAIDLLERARARLVPERDADVLDDVLLGLGTVFRDRGDLERARDLLGRVRGDADRPREPIIADMMIGHTWIYEGRLDRAREALDRATAAARANGAVDLRGVAAFLRGEMARLSDRWAEARAHYDEALALFERTGARYVLIGRLHLTIVRLLEPDDPAAPADPAVGARLDELGDVVRRASLTRLLPEVELATACLAARRADWSAWDAAIARAADLLARSEAHLRDEAWLAAHAAALARRAGQPDRARAADHLVAFCAARRNEAPRLRRTSEAPDSHGHGT